MRTPDFTISSHTLAPPKHTHTHIHTHTHTHRNIFCLLEALCLQTEIKFGGHVQWLMSIIPEFWEGKLGGLVKTNSSRPAWAKYKKKQYKINLKIIARHNDMYL